METMGLSYTTNTWCVINGLEITDIDIQHVIQLPEIYTKESVPYTVGQIPTQKDIQHWSLSSSRCETGPSGTPRATRTRLGWIVWNLARPDVSTFDFNF